MAINGLVQDCSDSSALAMELLRFALSHRHSSIATNGLVQDCSDSSALAMELLQFWTKPSIYKQ